MSNYYAQWDDGPYETPPRPPRRPSFYEWITMSEMERQAYEAGVHAYLMAQGDGSWHQRLCEMSLFYQTWLLNHGVQDANWKRKRA